MTHRFLAAAALMALLVPLRATAVPDSGDLRQSAERQEQIRGDARQLVARLDEVIAEYGRNGLAKGEDFEVLKNVRAMLGSLTDEEMGKVVALLKDAGAKPESAPGQIAKAYAGQKDISLRLKQILAAHEQQQDIDALAAAVSQLADRQSANLGTAIDVKQLAAQDKSANGQTAVTASEQAQQAEQVAIAGEVKLVADKLAKIATDAGDSKYKDAAGQLADVAPRATDAAGALGAGRIDDAVAAETAAREKLKQLAVALAPASQQDNFANNAAGQLAGIAQDQKALLDKTAQLNSALKATAANATQEAADKAMYQQIAKPTAKLAMQLAASGITPASPVDQIRNAPDIKKFLDSRAAGLKKQAADIGQQLAALAGDQAALATKAQIVREDLDKTVKEAAEPMANALTQMNTAQGALAQADGEQAAQSQADAISQLQEAEKLAEKLAAQDGGATGDQAQPAGTRMDQLRQLQKQVGDLTAKETGSIRQGDAQKTGPTATAAVAVQENMAGKAQDMRQAAAAADSTAAQPLQQAAGAMNNAAQTMQRGGMPDIAQAAQQTAVQALGNAAQQINQDIAATMLEQRQLAAMEAEMQGIEKLIHEQQQVDLGTQKAVDLQRAGKEKQLAYQQVVVRRDTEGLIQAVNVATPIVAQPLGQAAADMGEAVEQLNTEGALAAQAPEKAALAALFQAQDALAEKIQQTAQELAEPQAPPQAVANAEAQLAIAQNEVAAAQDAMDPGQNGAVNTAKAVGELNQATQRTAQAAAQPQALPPDARDAIRQAEQATGEAAAAASAGQPQLARKEAGQAQQAISAAQAALGQMQAGVSGLTQPSAQESQMAQQHSQGQGQSQSQSQQQGTEPSQRRSGMGAKEQAWTDPAGAVKRALAGAQGAGRYLGLPERDRGALQQSQSEKYPQEYGAMIEEYMRSLASDSGGK